MSFSKSLNGTADQVKEGAKSLGSEIAAQDEANAYQAEGAAAHKLECEIIADAVEKITATAKDDAHCSFSVGGHSSPDGTSGGVSINFNTNVQKSE